MKRFLFVILLSLGIVFVGNTTTAYADQCEDYYDFFVYASQRLPEIEDEIDYLWPAVHECTYRWTPRGLIVDCFNEGAYNQILYLEYEKEAIIYAVYDIWDNYYAENC